MSMDLLPMRLTPGQDLRQALEVAVAARGASAAYVVSGIGSLRDAPLRLAGADVPVLLAGDVEILTLAGSVSADGSHLHAAMATADGRVVGGHVPYGCHVRTTAEVLLALTRDWQFSRAFDALTGYSELTITPLAVTAGSASDDDDDDGHDSDDWGPRDRDHDRD